MLGQLTHAPMDALVPLYHGAETGGFPAENIPDGWIWYPHHFWTGLFVAVLAIYADGRDGKPVGTVGGILLSVYGWLFLWQRATSPLWGAVFSLIGVTAATLAVVVGPHWVTTPWRTRLRAAVARIQFARFVGPVETARRTGRWVVGVPRRVAGTVRWVGRHPVAAVGRVVTPRSVAVVGLLVAADDAYDHATHLVTPLQRWWVGGGHHLAGEVTRWVVELL